MAREMIRAVAVAPLPVALEGIPAQMAMGFTTGCIKPSVFIDDRASGRLLWRGSVSEETRSGSTEQGVRIITEMAREIARAIPPRAAR